MSESATQVGVARSRAAGLAPTLDLAAVWAALAEVMDPELPVLSVVDLGIVHRVTVEPTGGAIDVEILPTFVGCPALEVIKASIADRLGAFGRPVGVEATFEIPWTSDRITPAGREALAAAGIAPPTSGVDGGGSLIALEARVACPHCGSWRTTLENLFGPPSAGRSATAPSAGSHSKRSNRSDP